MAAALELVEVAVAHAVDRALDTAPERQRGQRHGRVGCGGVAGHAHVAEDWLSGAGDRSSPRSNVRIALAVLSHEVPDSFSRMRRIFA